MGRDPCEFRLTAYPVWTQSPHYFPEIFNDVQDVNKARNECINLCNSNKFYRNQCIENCITDSNAIELVNKKELKKKMLKEKYMNMKENFKDEKDENDENDKSNSKKENDDDSEDESFDDYMEGVNLTQFYISFTITIFIFIILIGYFLKTLLK